MGRRSSAFVTRPSGWQLISCKGYLLRGTRGDTLVRMVFLLMMRMSLISLSKDTEPRGLPPPITSSTIWVLGLLHLGYRKAKSAGQAAGPSQQVLLLARWVCRKLHFRDANLNRCVADPSHQLLSRLCRSSGLAAALLTLSSAFCFFPLQDLRWSFDCHCQALSSMFDSSRSTPRSERGKITLRCLNYVEDEIRARGSFLYILQPAAL